MADNFAVDHHSEILDKKLTIISSQLTSCISEFTNVFNDIGNRLIESIDKNTKTLSEIDKSIYSLSTETISESIVECSQSIDKLATTTIDICDGVESISKNISEISEFCEASFDNLLDIFNPETKGVAIRSELTTIKESIDGGFDKIIDFATNTVNDIFATPKYREDYENPD